MPSRSSHESRDPAASSQHAWQRSLLEANLDAVVIIGPNARVEDVNTPLEALTGRTRDELIGSDAALYLSDPGAARRLYHDAIRAGSVRDRALDVRHRAGHVTRVLCSASAYRDSEGQILGVVAAARPLSASVAESAPAAANDGLRRMARVIVALVSLIAIGLGAAGIALLASPGRADALRTLALPPPAIATSLILAGLSCGLLGAGLPIRWRGALTAAARLLAAAVLVGAGVELAGGLGLDGDEAHDAWSGVALLLLGSALLGSDWTITRNARRYWPAHVFTFAGGMISVAGLLDAVLGSHSPITSMPFSSSLGLFGLALGIVCARAEFSLGALLTSASLGGTLTRWLWPAAVVVPVLLGMAARRAAGAGLVPNEGELPALILSMITLLGALVIWNGRRIDQNDRVRQQMQDALSRREAELREAHRLARVGSWRWDIAQRRMTWSPELYRITGRDPTRPPPAFEELLGAQSGESSARFQAALQAAQHSGTPFELELTLLRPDGSQCFASARGEADRGADGSVVLLRGTVEDITERKLAEAELARVHRAQRASSRSNQVLVRATDEATLLQQVCEIIIENTDYRSCWVGRAETDAAKTVRILARAGDDGGYLAQSRHSWGDGPDQDGVGACIRTGRTVVITDIRSDARSSNWRERALAHGLASLVAIPLEVDGQMYGALVIYAAERGAFGAQELALLSELADDVAFGLTTLHTRAAHERAEAQVRQLNAELEARVQSRTAELQAANELKDLLLVRQQATSSELERAREREADVGFRIQRTLLLEAPPSDLPGLSVAASSIPSQRVDGDFYAFINHQDGVFDVIVGDVMGKGILAALLGAATKAHFLKAMGDLAGSRDARTLPRPKDIVMMAHAGVARHLIELESFVTLCYARVDLIERRLDFVDCGHTGIILANADTGATRLLQGTNLPLGVREGEVYHQISVALSPGDTLLLFSDGITDARDEAGESFGVERLERLLQQPGMTDVTQLVASVGSAVREFSRCAHPRDDQTCVALRVEAARLPLKHAELEIKSALEELGRVRDFVRGFCRGLPGAPLDDDAIAELVLATNEAISNIMKHAYGGDRDQLIIIEGDAFAELVSVRMRHLGSPFTPHAVPTPQFNGSRESGFGAYMIESSVDEVTYYRDTSGRSCVALFKKARRARKAQEQPSWN
jgi:sigma-B regulation protein RsbU (phosphoserine phosphatase)